MNQKFKKILFIKISRSLNNTQVFYRIVNYVLIMFTFNMYLT